MSTYIPYYKYTANISIVKCKICQAAQTSEREGRRTRSLINNKLLKISM